ncbi:hypothetical protein Avbf_12379 [Armadillidium vulgare]|nr:hypothetical protein Avbf_12379 [Armadillidium vulgare]
MEKELDFMGIDLENPYWKSPISYLNSSPFPHEKRYGSCTNFPTCRIGSITAGFYSSSSDFATIDNFRRIVFAFIRIAAALSETLVLLQKYATFGSSNIICVIEGRS